MSDVKPELRIVRSGQTDAGLATLELISQARQARAGARTLPDIRRVMEAASVAQDAAQRAARLFNAERRARRPTMRLPFGSRPRPRPVSCWPR